MPAKRFHQMVQDLTFEEKLTGIGSALLAVSAFLPWYQDIDTFNTGDMFLGITGPLYLAGFSLLLLSGLNIVTLLSEGFEVKLPFSLKKNAKMFLFHGILSFYLLFLASTIYSHPKFGFNIAVKELQFGMFLAYISAGLITFGGYMMTRSKASRVKDFQEVATDAPNKEVHQKQLIQMPQNEIRKPKENLRSNTTQLKQPVHKPVSKHIDQLPLQNKTVHAAPASQALSADQNNASDKKPQMYRMDL